MAQEFFRAGNRGGVTFAWTGLTETLNRMEQWREDVLAELKEATEAELDAMLATAQALTPVDTGRLHDSGRVLAPRATKNADKMTYQVVFGGIVVRGRFVDYAMAVHERHPTKSKFLERAEAQHIPGMDDRIEKRILTRVKT